MLLIIILVVITVLFYILGKLLNSDTFEFASLFTGVFTAFTIVAGVLFYIGTISTIAEMESFYNANQQSYSNTIEITRSLLSEDNDYGYIVDGDIERLGVGQSISDRVAEYRDAIADYNTKLAAYRAYKVNWFTNIFVPEIPEYLDFIILEDH